MRHGVLVDSMAVEARMLELALHVRLEIKAGPDNTKQRDLDVMQRRQRRRLRVITRRRRRWLRGYARRNKTGICLAGLPVGSSQSPHGAWLRILR